MSSSLGAISQYALAVQQMQFSLIKNAAQTQQQLVEVLFGDDNRTVPVSADKGSQVDLSV